MFKMKEERLKPERNFEDRGCIISDIIEGWIFGIIIIIIIIIIGIMAIFLIKGGG